MQKQLINYMQSQKEMSAHSSVVLSRQVVSSSAMLRSTWNSDENPMRFEKEREWCLQHENMTRLKLWL